MTMPREKKKEGTWNKVLGIGYFVLFPMAITDFFIILLMAFGIGIGAAVNYGLLLHSFLSVIAFVILTNTVELNVKVVRYGTHNK